ncbi:MAG: hypothetical protein JJ971_00285 [Balneolaceae bacterium]|nr:hypothetical protein [Balneolaceae bacterium]MBO6544808.1 hypothetical protein [Balneolaceae bacterium]MBO6646204.1 hypothetical protein [Balneolaceae bacterium]
MRSLPFYMDDLNGGFMKLEGILRVEKEKLYLEFQKTDAILETYKSDVKEIEIDISEISMMEYKKGLFSSKLTIHAKRAITFQDLPGNGLTERVLKVKKKHREIAASISSNINLALSERRLNELNGDDE